MHSFLLGAGLGTAAGVSPGPLLTLVVSTTLERGLAAGLRVAAAPLLSDAPVILVSLMALGRLPPSFLSWITVLGGLYVVYLGIRTLLDRHRPALGAADESRTAGTDYGRGILVNLLNPHPWIGWTTVLGPLAVEGWRRSPLEAIGFVALFYATIVGSTMAMAWVVSRGRDRIRGHWYPRLLAACGLLLVTFGLLLVRQGLAVDAGTMARHLAGP